MGAIAIDVNDIMSVNAACFRVLSDNVGDDVTRAFINQFKYSGVRAAAPRRRVTASEIADILEWAQAKAEAGRGKGDGDYTKEKYEYPPEESFEEITAGIMKIQSIMDDVAREHPELSAGQRTAEALNRMAAQELSPGAMTANS